ncbi:MAG: hypothetical protein QW767_05305 [Thermoprotei archaeon]
MHCRKRRAVSQSLEAIILVVVALSVVAVYAGWAFGVFGHTVNTPILTVMGTPSIQGSSGKPALYVTVKNSGIASADITQIYVNNMKVVINESTSSPYPALIAPGQAITMVVQLGSLSSPLSVGSTVSVVIDAGDASVTTTALVES